MHWLAWHARRGCARVSFRWSTEGSFLTRSMQVNAAHGRGRALWMTDRLLPLRMSMSIDDYGEVLVLSRRLPA